MRSRYAMTFSYALAAFICSLVESDCLVHMFVVVPHRQLWSSPRMRRSNTVWV